MIAVRARGSSSAPAESEPVILIEPDRGGQRPGAPAVAAPRIEVRSGEMVVVTGPPGSGKSALLAAAAGRAALPHVRASVGGIPLTDLPHRRRRAYCRALRLLYLPQEPALISNLSVIENLLLPIRYFGEMAEGAATKEALILLAAAGLRHTASHLPARLTLEDRKTVALLRGFLRSPTVALLDDPLSGLDEESLVAVRPLLRSALAGGRCAILAAAPDADLYTDLGAAIVPLAARRHTSVSQEPIPS